VVVAWHRPCRQRHGGDRKAKSRFHHETLKNSDSAATAAVRPTRIGIKVARCDFENLVPEAVLCGGSPRPVAANRMKPRETTGECKVVTDGVHARVSLPLPRFLRTRPRPWRHFLWLTTSAETVPRPFLIASILANFSRDSPD
jgi:hypothetical protein